MKLMITGGHITPAIAIIDECIQRNIEIVLVGRTYAYKRDVETMEAKLVKARNIPHIHLDAGRLTRTVSITSLIHFIKIPTGFIKSFLILKKTKPDIVLTFGGYIALPIAISAYILKIPVFLHEQVIIPGITNRILSNICKKIFVSFPQSLQYFPKHKTIITGNPIRKSIVAYTPIPKFEQLQKPLLYVTGGSLGSHAINTHIEKIVPELLKRFVVIHQTGNVPPYFDFDRLSKLQREGYYVYNNVLEDNIGYIYDKADIVISRSGANTVFDLIVTKTPSVLIPLPYSGYGEQLAQAKLLEKSGVAKIFLQHESSDKLLDDIFDVYDNKAQYMKGFATLQSYYKKDSQNVILHEMGL